jgi:hypothetical protein
MHFYGVVIKFRWFKFKLNAIYEELRPLCTITSVFIGTSLEQNVVKCDLKLLQPDVKKRNKLYRWAILFFRYSVDREVSHNIHFISPKSSTLIQEADMNFYGIISYDMFHLHTHILKFPYRHIYISFNTLCPKHFKGHCYPLSLKLLRSYRFT